MKTHFLAFWNVENLFDVADYPLRAPSLQRKLAGELKGWDGDVLARKIAQLALIIAQMNGGRGPDLLGVCEVENRHVLELLVESLGPLGRNYDIAHHDGNDQRGIDVAFVYDRNSFGKQEQFSHFVLKRTTTRDIFQVNFTTADGRELIVIGNHWPSRSNGTLESEPYRITAGETLGYWRERIDQLKGHNAAVVVMGDFNDEPFNRSITDHALAGNCEIKVRNAQAPRFYNLMWPLLGEGLGTHYYDNFPSVLDQLWVSKGIVTGKSGFRVSPGSVKVERSASMVATGDYRAPIRFGRPADTMNWDGFSDHYPVSMVLEEG